jgi:hypothetical protein
MRVLILLFLVLAVPLAAANPSQAPSPRGLLVDGETVPYTVFAAFPLPDEPVRVEPLGGPAGWTAKAAAGQLSETAQGWTWSHAQAGGPYALVLEDPQGTRWTLNVFVRVPAGQLVDGVLEGYRIGHYPAKPLKGEAIYLPPRGFVRVTRENEKTPVSPHFTLGEFLAKQVSAYPKFLVLRPRLLIKLEHLVESLHAEGIDRGQLRIMSGYRTPHYNKAIGNVPYSRHVYGGAADIYIHRGGSQSGSGGGWGDVSDVHMLHRVALAVTEQSDRRHLEGGLGLYRANTVRGPFLHVDVRGTPARWGAL